MDSLTAFDDLLDKIKIPIYNSSLFLIYAAYIFALAGVIYIDPLQINKLSIFVQFFVSMFLIYRFHPFRSHELRKYDSQLIFGSGLFLLANLGITQYIIQRIVPNVGVDLLSLSSKQ